MTADNQAAILFAIGPVQDFIATARKGQDFWYGSWLLSELSRMAASTGRDLGADLILPAPASLLRGEAVANKVIARIHSSDAVRVAEKMEATVRARLQDLASQVFDRIESTDEGRYLWRASADAQVADLPEIYWVVVDEAPEGWNETRRRAEAALAARKALRDFRPVTWGAPVPKSRLDGQRESVIDERAFPRRSAAGRIERLRTSLGIARAERLCGVGLFKRNGHRVLSDAQIEGARVLSTAHVASWSLRRAWADAPATHADLKSAFHDFRRALPDGGAVLSKTPPVHGDPVLGTVDGQVLYDTSLQELYEDADLIAARAALSRFLEVVQAVLKSNAISRPTLSPYYTILRADGDHMGVWLDSLPTPQECQRASGVLGEFARSAERIVAEHHGHCVYAGGDDVLALLPVATALDCAAALNGSFLTFVKEGPRGATSPTLSVGMQIAHATTPFRDALAGAGEAEQAAKLRYNRAAFAIRLEKRSGSPVLVGGKWPSLASFRNMQRLQEPQYGAIPRGLAYDLGGISNRLHGDDPRLNSIRTLELDRVLRQKHLDEAVVEAIWDHIGRRDLDADTLKRACDELVVTRALAALDGDET